MVKDSLSLYVLVFPAQIIPGLFKELSFFFDLGKMNFYQYKDLLGDGHQLRHETMSVPGGAIVVFSPPFLSLV